MYVAISGIANVRNLVSVAGISGKMPNCAKMSHAITATLTAASGSADRTFVRIAAISASFSLLD